MTRISLLVRGWPRQIEALVDEGARVLLAGAEGDLACVDGGGVEQIADGRAHWIRHRCTRSMCFWIAASPASVGFARWTRWALRRRAVSGPLRSCETMTSSSRARTARAHSEMVAPIQQRGRPHDPHVHLEGQEAVGERLADERADAERRAGDGDRGRHEDRGGRATQPEAERDQEDDGKNQVRESKGRSGPWAGIEEDEHGDRHQRRDERPASTMRRSDRSTRRSYRYLPPRRATASRRRCRRSRRRATTRSPGSRRGGGPRGGGSRRRLWRSPWC